MYYIIYLGKTYIILLYLSQFELLNIVSSYFNEDINYYQLYLLCSKLYIYVRVANHFSFHGREVQYPRGN